MHQPLRHLTWHLVRDNICVWGEWAGVQGKIPTISPKLSQAVNANAQNRIVDVTESGSGLSTISPKLGPGLTEWHITHLI